MKHVVMFSGGVGSWAAAARVVAANGPDDVTLLFADTLIEDHDLYRFMDDCERDLGVQVTRIVEGRTPWEVFSDEHFLGNSRIDPCSKILKRQFMRRWLNEHCDPAYTTIYLGYEWAEPHRIERAARFWSPWQVRSPLADKPYLTKTEIIAWAQTRNLEPPRLYALGFSHNNCGGGCVKAGISHFALLHDRLPDVYAEWERHEEELRTQLGNVSILTDRRGGKRAPMTLQTLRERIEAQMPLPTDDWGGCSCLEEPDPLVQSLRRSRNDQ